MIRFYFNIHNDRYFNIQSKGSIDFLFKANAYISLEYFLFIRQLRFIILLVKIFHERDNRFSDSLYVFLSMMMMMFL